MKTLWLKIPEWETYEISTDSEIRKNGRVINQFTRTQGLPYKSVRLVQGKDKQTFLVHMLVARTFIPNPDNLPCVGHKDENPTNNCVDNLYWTTYKENNNYGSHNKKVSRAMQIPVTRFIDGEEVDYFHGAGEAAEETGINKAHISQCCTGKRKSAGGSNWDYSYTLF